MCLEIWDDGDHEYLGGGVRRARKEHTCRECGRTIEPGELYWWETKIEYGNPPWTDKMCGHCRGTILLGLSVTGCPDAWYWDVIHDLGSDGGFVRDILDHELTRTQRLRMLRTVAGRRRRWRRKDGTLLPLPAPLTRPSEGAQEGAA